MKFTRNTASKGLLVPYVMLKLCKFQAGDNVDLYPMDNALVALKGHLTAPELLEAVQQLSDLSASLLYDLSKVCGPCTDCGADCCPGDDLADPDGEAIRINDFLIRDAGIPEGAKLRAEVDKERHRVTVSAADHRYDLSDLHPELLDTFIAVGTCLRALEEHLMREDIVYGK